MPPALHRSTSPVDAALTAAAARQPQMEVLFRRSDQATRQPRRGSEEDDDWWSTTFGAKPSHARRGGGGGAAATAPAASAAVADRVTYGIKGFCERMAARAPGSTAAAAAPLHAMPPRRHKGGASRGPAALCPPCLTGAPSYSQEAVESSTSEPSAAAAASLADNLLERFVSSVGPASSRTHFPSVSEESVSERASRSAHVSAMAKVEAMAKV